MWWEPVSSLLEDDGRGTRPLYERIADRARVAMRTGLLAPGDRLPPIRRLAASLGVNRDTVAQAYEALGQSGAVESVVGRGTFVRQSSVGGPGRDSPLAPPPFSTVVQRLLDFERARPEYETSDAPIALHALMPDPSLYPVAGFRRSLNRALAEGGSALLGYGGHRGNARLRTTIASRLRSHGMSADPDDVVPCHGASQGIALALQLYAEPGDWVAVEEPTYHNVLGVLVGLGLRAAPIPMTDEGPDLEVLDQTLRRPEVKLFYTMPSFHNPMGISTGAEHRRRLLAIATAHRKPVIEDAFEMDLRYDGRAVPPLAALDPHGLVVHLFSFSKSLFPGVRVGAITARGHTVDGLLALKHTTDLSGALILQAAVADFVSCGGYDRHLKVLHAALRDRRDALLAALERELTGIATWTEPTGGYQIWVRLPLAVDTRALLEDAKRAGVMFAPGYQFNHDGRPSSALRLTTALAAPPAIDEGVRVLGDLVRRRLEAFRPGRGQDVAVHV